MRIRIFPFVDSKWKSLLILVKNSAEWAHLRSGVPIFLRKKTMNEVHPISAEGLSDGSHGMGGCARPLSRILKLYLRSSAAVTLDSP